ncbi:MAG: nucleoside/nucleotide kinase family protein [Boseongicola sp. SB0664_bin_43]|uniref:Nucleoside/nucleotide kinase family protein n=1 Tax=Boseongicola sp. SB0664_bin_43 TaxID=2604844 RepID=A0A6B0XX78_9RHOB|nr:nucleoside/nucleotide kinase family protein [Boseongicola sp. SB0664_bin_43]MYK30260.1 nucleoside/nucleotide kinase family protein [Boseongicola sp. SB0670_bin_30]
MTTALKARIQAVAEGIRALPEGRRRLIAIAGPPGAGKSTLAAALVQVLGPTAALVPMDGFHFDNDTLTARGLRNRKGAPETFDLEGLSRLLEQLVHEDEVAVPAFDRALDKVVGSSTFVRTGHRWVIVEGNYLLLDEPGWRDLSRQWDLSVYLDEPYDVLEERLIHRWLDLGLSLEDSRAWAFGNDIPNARRVAAARLPAGLVLS